MKLTRHELIHATDKQLEAISIKRKGNSGWLEVALLLDFNDRAIKAFWDARTKPMPKPRENVPRQPQVSGEKESLITAFVARCTGVMEERQRERAEAKAIFQPYIADQYFDIKILCEDAEKVMRSLIANPSSPESAADALYAQSGRDLA